ncbi:rhomboid family intramembrane serine protease [Natronorubrum thiooxidans]|uniref:Rhomboid family protein n=1 Tax=Natronorubrum thiooxidans TaxID=308853 RepID=A0A1N7H2Q2_9EURY|nr:rhomboid family intramembrane serine protease [Natronorubrum thiooxidans]SIS18968.1 Rhomboid family protein [Natronorubrum thiooxidans]
MNRDVVPWATALLTVWMVGLYLLDPVPDTTAKYFFLSPWMHSGWSHFWNNMAFFIPLGIYAERRVDSIPFLAFAVLIPYLALHVPPLWGLGGWSQGASGLTKALTSYAIPALLVGFSGQLEDLSDFEFDWQEVAVAVLMLLATVFLTVNGWATVQRFAGLESSPDGVSVGSHFFGLVFGMLWFAWRAMRHGLVDA